MRALITGGAGFIGSHLAERLLAGGHHVVLLDDLSTGSLRNIAHLRHDPRLTYHIGSVENEPLVAKLVAEVDVVFHLAAPVGATLAAARPVHVIESNTNGAATVLRHARNHKRMVVLASSSDAYGNSERQLLGENDDVTIDAPRSPRWAPATSTLLIESLALAYFHEHQLPVIVVRLFHTVGPRQSDRFGAVLPAFVQAALEGSPLAIYGDGSQRRSFAWVGDAVSGLLGLVHESSAVGEIFNLGTSAETSIRELATRVLQQTGSASPLAFVPVNRVADGRTSSASRRTPDLTKINRFIGYAPTVHLDAIIERTVAYWRAERDRTAETRAPGRSAVGVGR